MMYVYSAFSAVGMGVFFGLTIGFGMQAAGRGPASALLMFPLVFFCVMPALIGTAWLWFAPR